MKKEHNLPGHYTPYDKDLEEFFSRAVCIDNIVLNYLREIDRAYSILRSPSAAAGVSYR